MKAISEIQPFGTLMVIGAKGIETRPNKVNFKNYRGPVLIHTSAKMPKWAVDLYYKGPIRSTLLRAGIPIQCLALGAIIGMVTIYDVISLDEYTPPEPERSFGDYSPGRIGFKIKDPIMFKNPIPAKGQLGLWNWDVIIFDRIGHMISTKSYDHLHKFAKKIGLKRSWFQEKGNLSHYDLTTSSARERARQAGAIEVHIRDLVPILEAVYGNG